MKAKNRNIEQDLEAVHACLIRAGEHNLQSEVMWTALDLALDGGFKDSFEKQGEVVDINLLLQCACSDWDV